MAQQSILVTQTGSTFAQPSQYTPQSPSLARYRMTSTMTNYGDYAGTAAQNAGGIVANGFIDVQFHVNNQWTTGTIYVTQTGAQIKTLVEA